jgi:formamidopyrimidine-DNA glycosylase
MIEIPESKNLARQIKDTIGGKKITSVTAGYTPHKMAWYYGDRATYAGLLAGQEVGKGGSFGGWVEIGVGKADILLGEGVGIRYHQKGKPRPSKHQLLIEFGDGSAVSASVQMYGGLGVIADKELDNPYYKVAREKPSPLSPEFDKSYFEEIIGVPESQKLSLKALLATEQRIPGLGNGVLQDILFNAGMHPKKKAGTLSDKERGILFDSLKKTLSEMTSQGGRDTELDLFGRPGGYKTILSKNTASKPCPVCGTIIKKEAYLGGSIYYCENCQTM